MNMSFLMVPADGFKMPRADGGKRALDRSRKVDTTGAGRTELTKLEKDPINPDIFRGFTC
jgi:hypothetical protein